MSRNLLPWHIQIFYLTGLFVVAFAVFQWVFGDSVSARSVFFIFGASCLVVGVSRFASSRLDRGET